LGFTDNVEPVATKDTCSFDPGIRMSGFTLFAKPGPRALEGLEVVMPGNGSTLNKRISGHIPYGYNLSSDGETLMPNPSSWHSIHLGAIGR
jgi:hypothetical protein